MDSLRPDLDELKQYKNRQDGGKKSTKRTVAPNSTSGTSSSVASQHKQGGQPSGSMSLFARFIMVLLFFGCAGLGYFAWMQQQNLAALNHKILESDSFINQSKLLMARIEGELTETGAELEQSGSDAKKKLDFLDSEMRKLWGVSNDRNKKSIKTNSAEIDKLNASLIEQKKGVSSLNSKLKTVNTEVTSLGGRLATISGEASIVRSEQEEKIARLQAEIDKYVQSESALKVRLEALEKAHKADQKALAEIGPSLASMNESRRQLVNRVVNLEGKLEKLMSPPKKNELNVTR